MPRHHAHWNRFSLLAAACLLAAGCHGRSADTGSPRAKVGGGSTPSVQDNMTVQIDYTLTVDGKLVDTSQGKAPLSYVHGRHQIIPGLERELIGLRAGDKKDVMVAPADGYGDVNPKAVVTVPKTQLPQNLQPEVGAVIRGRDGKGHPILATIKEIGTDNVTLDLNHPLAGKTLHFTVTVVAVKPAA